MKVKIADKMYDLKEVPCLIIFESREEFEEMRENMKNSAPSLKGYAMFPETSEWDDPSKRLEWMQKDVPCDDTSSK